MVVWIGTSILVYSIPIIKEEDMNGSLDRSQYPGMDESFREIKQSNQLISVSTYYHDK